MSDQTAQKTHVSPVSQTFKDISKDVEHITKEMYKKNLQLAETNKTLLLLRTIDEIILSSVTDPKEIARQVARILVTEGEFQIACISIRHQDSSQLVQLAASFNESLHEIKSELSKVLSDSKNMSISNKNHLLSQTSHQKKPYFTKKFSEVFITHFSPEDNVKLQDKTHCKTFLTYPLIVRAESIGVLVVGHTSSFKEITEYDFDLLKRLVDVVGIALDNAILYNEVQSSNEKLKEIDKLKDEFVSLASHELRTPMTAIKSYLWMAIQGKGGPLSEKQKYYLDRAYRSTDRLIKLVNDMLNISRIESGRISIELEDVEISRLSQEVIEEVMPRAEELGIHLTLLPLAQLPHVMADSDKIKEVLLNLIGNSLKFTPKDGHITVSFSNENGFIKIVVADNGAGIPNEDIPKLFQKFSLLPGSYTVNKVATQGTGLGLYICKSIIELHGGKIWVESPGVRQGATFSFTLPQVDVAKITHGDAKRGSFELVHTQL